MSVLSKKQAKMTKFWRQIFCTHIVMYGIVTNMDNILLLFMVEFVPMAISTKINLSLITWNDIL